MLDGDDKPTVVATPRPVITSGRSVVRAVETAPPLEYDGGPDEGFYSDTPF